VLCRAAGDGVTRRTATPAQLAAVQQVLADPVAVPSTGDCVPQGGEQHELLARYDTGPAVLVRVADGCAADVDNGSLQARLAPAAAQQLRAVLAQALG
jgi:hypothetical protein